MVKVIGVEKSGTLKELNWDMKNIQYTDNDKILEALAKKAGFKNANDFEQVCTWELDDISVHLFGKIHGRANYENKYDFPPPVDELLFFGTCILIATENNDQDVEEETSNNEIQSKEINENNSNIITDLTINKWKKIYEELFGGFEDLVSETSSEDELENIPSSMKTNNGYLKDDFVVNDDEIEYNEQNGSDKSEEELLEENVEDEEDSELSEECFLYSDEEN